MTHLGSADHSAPIFHTGRDGHWQVTADDPAGEQALDVILDAVGTARDGSTG